MGIAMGMACIAALLAETGGLGPAGAPWPSWLAHCRAVVAPEMMVAMAGLLAGRIGLPPYSGFSCGGLAMSMWSEMTGVWGQAVTTVLGPALWTTRLVAASLTPTSLATVCDTTPDGPADLCCCFPCWAALRTGTSISL